MNYTFIEAHIEETPYTVGFVKAQVGNTNVWIKMGKGKNGLFSSIPSVKLGEKWHAAIEFSDPNFTNSLCMEAKKYFEAQKALKSEPKAEFVEEDGLPF